MRIFKPARTSIILLTMCLALAACKSSEERAEEHYQNSITLAEAGDVDRAIIELRNVFQLNGSHREARHKLAELQLNEKGNRQAAYSQYLRLVEQYPDDLKARIILSEIAFQVANWDEVERHGERAAELDPENTRVQAISIARAYRAAALDENASERRTQADAATNLMSAEPENLLLRNVLIDNALRDGEFRQALEDIDWVLERDPENRQYWRQRLAILGQLGDMDGVEVQLRKMVGLFPEDVSNKTTLVRFYMSRQEHDKAEGFLRELVAAEPDNHEPAVDLIRFLAQVRSVETAKAEIGKLIAEREDPVPFQVLDAGFDFASGERETAIATLEGVLEGAEPSDQTRDIKIALARMLTQMGNEVGARARVEDVLSEDPAEPNALKLQAAWLIEADDTDAAIASLRTALDAAPEDSQAMTLMAQAYTRSGRPELARDFLALAVEASGNAPAETLRYARVLIGEERYLPAEDILLPALRLDPQNIDLLLALGQLYLGMDDDGRARQVVATLRQINTPVSNNAANGLEAERINRQSGPDQAITYLEDIANSTDATLASKISLVRARLSTGDAQGALDLAQKLLADDPDNPTLQTVMAATLSVNGELDKALEMYRALVTDNPNRPTLWLEMARLNIRKGDPEGGRAIVAEGLEANPGEPNLLWAQASYMEADGDFDGAIGIYEELYERDSNSVVVANNLASLLSTTRTDEASLNRAWTIARRFSDTDIPALQDTYGWIAHKRGESETALPYLEAAAKGLPGDALVQYHLGEVYLALSRSKEALDQFRRAVQVAGPSDQRPQIAKARTQIVTLEAAGGTAVEN